MRTILFIGLLILGLFTLSCTTANNPTYQLTTTVSPSEGGTISPSSGTYSEGETVTLTGTPSTGWRFVRWEGDLSSTQNLSTLTMTKDYSVVGIFEKRNFPLTINIEGFGEVEERVIQQKTTDYPYQTVVELTPIPDEGWRFVDWSGDLNGNEVPKQITVDGEKTVTAKFERKNYPLTINIVGEGTVTETVLPQRTTQYPFETIVELTPVPLEGWEFVEWSGDLSGNENPQLIVVDGDKSVTVTFQLKTYPVNVSVEGSGTISLEPQLEAYQHGSTVTLTSVPSEGWEFIEWSGDIESTTVPLEVTVTSELNIVGVFGRKDYPLTVNVIGEGSVEERIIPQRTTQHPYETLVELTSKPTDGWVFYRWRGDLSGNENPITIEIDESKTVTSEFKSIDELLTIEIIGEGTVEIQQESFESNRSRSRISLTTAPTEGWRFVEWGGDLSGAENPTNIDLIDFKSVIAKFERIIYTLNIEIEGEGTVNRDSEQTEFSFNDRVSLKAVPEQGWMFNMWLGHENSTSNPIELVFDRNHDLTAKFTQIMHPVDIVVYGSGSVTRNVMSTQENMYPEGTIIQLTARPGNGWYFSHWTGSIDSTSQNPISIRVDSSTTINANFLRNNYTVNLLSNGSGNIVISPTSNDSLFQFESSVQIHATPNQDWRFDGWTGDVSSTNNPHTFRVLRNMSITGNFSEKDPVFDSMQFTDIQSEKVTVSVNISYLGLHQISSAGFCFNIPGNNETCETGEFDNNSIRLELDELTPKTVYSIRPFVVSQIGRSHGGSFQFQTRFFDPGPTFYDADFNVYNTIVINGQTWMRENLRSTTYLDGGRITGWVYPGNDSSNDRIYGKLYPYSVVFSGRNPCPYGFRLPNNEDWIQLIQFAENAWNLKHTSWDIGRSTNLSGFSGLPAGNAENGSIRNFGTNSFWWSTSGWNIVNLTQQVGSVNRFGASGGWSGSIRCILNE